MSRESSVDHLEPVQLSPQQAALVDSFLLHGDRERAFREAGYVCSNPAQLQARIAKAFSAPLVVKELNRRQQMALSEKALAKRVTPLDIMLENMTHWIEKAREADDPVKALAMRGMAQKAAADAAPYMHPRLQAIAVSRRINLRDMSDDELDAFITDIEQQMAEMGDAEGRGSSRAGTPQVIEGTARRTS